MELAGGKVRNDELRMGSGGMTGPVARIGFIPTDRRKGSLEFPFKIGKFHRNFLRVYGKSPGFGRKCHGWG